MSKGKTRYIHNSNIMRKIVIDNILDNFEDWSIEELPPEGKSYIRTYIFTKVEYYNGEKEIPGTDKEISKYNKLIEKRRRKYLIDSPA
jgi:hypothetical protein